MVEQDIGKLIFIFKKMLKSLRGNFLPQVDIPLGKTEVLTLMEVRAHPHRPMKHYVNVVNIECGSFTYLANKLEEKKLVRRVTASDDKRKTVLELTEKGVAVTDELCMQFDTYVSQQIACLTPHDRTALKLAAHTLEGILEKLEEHHG